MTGLALKSAILAMAVSWPNVDLTFEVSRRPGDVPRAGLPAGPIG